MTERIQNDERDPDLSEDNPRPITAQHYIPDTAADVTIGGCNFRKDFLCFLTAEGVDPDAIEPSEGPAIVIANSWIHTDAHGVLTRDEFEEDLALCLKKFAQFIATHYLPFEPVRIAPAQDAYAMGVYDHCGDEFPFDIRVLIEFRASNMVETDQKENIFSPGFRYTIATKVKYNEARDADTYVGQDFSTFYDEEIDNG